ncbi:Crp/Fnr family transcriptional regulator [Pseudomonas sp. GD03842]|uniref:Crp/Fnr family transcriptional regulator n=1 Tax=Pseudomonas sp. GD03842 TaxID=2975385 RepID=UPI0024469054|nr:Crp/Fnr family transcriptional regulator [Pseudomonas sp. GD03842]MDH0749438.1 Crp/Fnr family transcriptional regulator [Pseudomonas sp. GD03842]
MTNGTQWRSWLLNDHWFNDLPASLQDSLLMGMRQRRFTPGKLIFERGAPPCGLYALLDGSLRFNDLKQQSQWLPCPVTARPYWFGEVSLFDDRPRLRDVYAADQLILLHMPQAPLEQLLNEQPRYWRYFADLLRRKLNLGVPSPEQMTSLPTDERVAFRLLMLAQGYGDMDRSVRIISIADLHSTRCLGLAPDVVDRVLEQFAERGLLRRDHDFISELDIGRLRTVAQHRLTFAGA